MSVEIRFVENIDVDKQSNKGLERGILETALNIKREAKLLAPVALKFGGRLRNSIDVSDLNNNQEIRVGTNVEYSVYQEYGTRKMSAQPFMRPALEIAKGASVEDTKKALNEVMD